MRKRYTPQTALACAVAYGVTTALRYELSAYALETGIEHFVQGIVNHVRTWVYVLRARLAHRLYTLSQWVTPCDSAITIPHALETPTIAPVATSAPKTPSAPAVLMVASENGVPHERRQRKGKDKTRTDYRKAKDVVPGAVYWYKVDGKWREMCAPSLRQAA